MNDIFHHNSSNRWVKVALVLGGTAILSRVFRFFIQFSFFLWFLRIGVPFLTIGILLYLGSSGILPYLQWKFNPSPFPQPDPIEYCEHFNIEEIKKSAPWVPAVVSFNYLLIFLWVSFFSLLFFDPAASSGLFYLGVYLVFVLCFGTFLFLINLFYRKMDHSLFTLSCNLITLFFCGITTSSMNNLTHYLHVKGPSLYDIGFSVIPEIPLKYAETSDVILVSYILLCVLRSLFLHPAVRNKMWADFGRISSIMILCKGVMGWWTLLPGPAPHCRPGTPNYAPATVKNIFINQGTMFGHALNCGDLIFSGHTGFLVTVMLLSEELWKAKRPIVRWIWRGFTLFTLLLFSIFCLAARKHYSVDIVSAYLIAGLLYCTFRHSWIPIHLTYPVTRTVIIRASVSGTEPTKSDTIIVSEEKTQPRFRRYSAESESN